MFRRQTGKVNYFLILLCFLCILSFTSRNWLQHIEKSKGQNKTPSLLRVLITTFWPEYLSLGIILATLEIGVRLTQPLILGKLLDYFGKNTIVSREAAVWYAMGLVALDCVKAFLINHYFVGAFHYGMRVRAACCALIYRKVCVYLLLIPV